MNVRKVKRMSKRTVSTLLSVLMVISLFTVCMVGTTVTVGAGYFVNNGYVYYDNNYTPDWEEVYAYYDELNDDDSVYNWAKMERVEDSQLFRLKIGISTNTPSWNYGSSSSQSLGQVAFANCLPNNIETSNYANNNTNNTYGNMKLSKFKTISAGNKTVVTFIGDLNNDGKPAVFAASNGLNQGLAYGNKHYGADAGKVSFDSSEWGLDSSVDTLYLYYGQDECYGSGYCSKATLKRIVGTNIFETESNLSSWNSNKDMVGYFVSKDDMTAGSGKYIDALHKKAITDGYGNTTTKLTNKDLKASSLLTVENDKSITVTENYQNTDKYAYVNATLYNYLYNDTNTTSITTICQNRKQDHQDSSNLHFSQYNRAVATWYKSQVEAHVGDYTIGNTTAKATPLYQGNFRDGTGKGTDGTLGGSTANNRGFTEYNFVSVANGANRYNGISGKDNANPPNLIDDSTRALGMYLVDKEMKDTNSDGIGDTLVQHGIEVPQFSDKFTKKNSSLQWSDNITFPMDKEYTDKGHIRYYYRAYNGANRYYDETKVDPNDSTRKQMQVGGNVGTGAGYGYFPFDKTQNSQLINGFGTRFDIEFVMPEGRMLDYGDTEKQEKLDFTFYGDDDVWVFIDGYLALDMGGQHNNARGSINLTDGTFTLYSGNYNASFESVGETNQYSAGTGINGQYGSSKTWAYGTSNANNSYANEFEFNTKLEEVLSQTNQKHTLTVFYMERGEWDSNFRMEYMLPAITQTDNEVTITQTVNGEAVNDGLRLKTMEIANQDVFAVDVTQQYMNNATENLIKLPIGDASNNGTPFTRRTSLEVDETSPSTLTMQAREKLTGTAYSTLNSGAGSTKTAIKSCYSWVDNSKLLDMYGNEVTPSKKSATYAGVGKPQNITGVGTSIVPLLYGQSAIFYNQFSQYPGNDVVGGGHDPANIHLNSADTILRFKSGDTEYATDTGIRNLQNTDRYVDDYYTTKCSLKGAYTGGYNNKSYELTTKEGDGFLETNKASFTYEHDIKVGSVTIKKKVEGDDKDANGTKTEYTFEILYRNLFGETDTTATLTTPNKDVTQENWKTADLVGTRSGSDAENNPYTSENNTLVAYDGRFGMVGDSEVRFDGIPVGTMIQIREYSENNPKTGEASTIGKVIFSGEVAENLRIDGTVGTWSTKTNEKLGVTIDVNATLDNEKKTLLTAHTDTYKMVNNQNWVYNFTNSFANIPVLYRYIDRKVVDGKPTGLNSGYTYFTKGVTLPYNELLARQKDGEGHDIADTDYGFKLTKTITRDAKINACDLSPNIINVICKYNLSYDTSKNTESQYYTNQELEYANRNTYYTYNSTTHQYDVNTSVTGVAGTKNNAFELRDVTDELNAVLGVMNDNCTFTDNTYDALSEQQVVGSMSAEDKNTPVNLKDTIRNILERAVKDWKLSNPGTITKSVLQAYLKANYFYVDEDSHYYVIQATYANELRLYDVDIQFYAPTTGIDTNNDGTLEYKAGEVVQIKYGTPFNGLSSLAAPGKEAGNTGNLYNFDRQFYDDTSRDIVKALDLDETSNELFRIKLATGKYAYFAYWERQVSYNDGDQLTTEWIPVSTNFNYHYRVNDHVRIRAVYQIESSDSNDGKRYNGVTRDSSGNFESFYAPSDFKYIDKNAKQMSELYEPLQKSVKWIYWMKDGDGNRKYRTKTDPADGPFTGNLSSGGTEPTADDYSLAPSNPLYVEEKEPIGLSPAELDESSATGIHTIALIKEGADGHTTTENLTDQQLYQVGYNVPNSTGILGYTTSSTDKTYNSYTTEVLNSTTNQYEKQDRTRVDIMFGTPTSDNEDSTIDYVGYVLYRSPKYNDASEAKYGIVDNLRDAITTNGGTINGKLNTMVNSLNAAKAPSDPNDHKNYKKQTLSTTYADDGANGDNKTYTAVYSLAPVTFDSNEGGNGKIYLTNKNRYNVVFSLKNDEEARKYYYTAFLVTVRNGKYYVSDSPATFCLSEADPAIKEGDGQRSYTMIIKNCLATDDGNGGYTYTDDKPYVGAEMCNYTTAVNGRELSFTTRTYTWVDPSTHIPYTGELKKLVVGNKAYTGSEIEGVKTGGTKKVTFNTTTTDFINDPVNTSSFTVKAYFERIVLGCSFTINQKANTSVRTTVVSETGASVPSFSKIYGTASANTSYDHVQIVPYNGRLKVTVKVPDGFVIGDRNEAINTLIEQGKIIETLSTDKKTWTAEVDEVYKLKAQSDGSNSDASVGLPYTYATYDDIYEQLLANLPGAVEKSYTFKIKTNPESILSTSGNIKLDNTNIDTTQISNNEYVVRIFASQLDGNGQKTFTLKAKTDVTNYDFSGWSDGTTTGTTGEVTYTFDADTMDGNTVTATYTASGTYVYFDATGFTNYTFYLQGVSGYSDVGMTKISGTNVFKSNSKVAYNYTFVVRTQGANVQSEQNNHGHVTDQNNYFGFGNQNNDGHYILTYKGNYTGTGS